MVHCNDYLLLWERSILTNYHQHWLASKYLRCCSCNIQETGNQKPENRKLEIRNWKTENWKSETGKQKIEMVFQKLHLRNVFLSLFQFNRDNQTIPTRRSNSQLVRLFITLKNSSTSHRG